MTILFKSSLDIRFLHLLSVKAYAQLLAHFFFNLEHGNFFLHFLDIFFGYVSLQGHKPTQADKSEHVKMQGIKMNLTWRKLENLSVFPFRVITYTTYFFVLFP